MYEEIIQRLRETSSVMLLEAADVIEEEDMNFRHLERDYKDLCRYLPKWIPVTERLPDEGKFVLVYGDLYPNKHDGSAIAVSKRMDWNYWQGFGRDRNITHWMPLPEPPKEET